MSVPVPDVDGFIVPGCVRVCVSCLGRVEFNTEVAEVLVGEFHTCYICGMRGPYGCEVVRECGCPDVHCV